MMTPAIVPTITQRVRIFLADQGAALRPWSGLQETYDELYGLLRMRRKDPEFWLPLKGLLREVVASAADSQKRGPAGTAHAELLASWKVDELVDELRDALPEDATSARTDFTRSLSTAVLGGFLLLGLAAAGCGGNDAEKVSGTGGTLGTGGATATLPASGGMSGTGGATATLPGTGGAGGSVAGSSTGQPIDGGEDARKDAAFDGADGADVDGGAADVADETGIDVAPPACTQTMAPELDRAIGQSSLATAQKTQLCACFGALGAEWTTGLTQLFATATPEEISRMLSGLAQCCRSSGIVGTRGTLITSPSASDLNAVKNGLSWSFCATPVYKGVSFPE